MSGEKVVKQSYTKFKRNKVVRGTFYAYAVGDNNITATQFENILYRLKKVENECTLSKLVYEFNI